MFIEIPISPLNEQSRVIEERYYSELVRDARDADSMAEVLAHQVPNLRSSEKRPPVSNRMAMFRKAGLIGSFNDTDVNSQNYRNILREERK